MRKHKSRKHSIKEQGPVVKIVYGVQSVAKVGGQAPAPRLTPAKALEVAAIGTSGVLGAVAVSHSPELQAKLRSELTHLDEERQKLERSIHEATERLAKVKRERESINLVLELVPVAESFGAGRYFSGAIRGGAALATFFKNGGR